MCLHPTPPRPSFACLLLLQAQASISYNYASTETNTVRTNTQASLPFLRGTLPRKARVFEGRWLTSPAALARP